VDEVRPLLVRGTNPVPMTVWVTPSDAARDSTVSRLLGTGDHAIPSVIGVVHSFSCYPTGHLCTPSNLLR
jgi:hypothetical protein